MGFPDGSVGKESACNARDTGDPGLIPGLGRSPGGGNDNPPQHSGLENPTDRGACRATVQRVSESHTRLETEQRGPNRKSQDSEDSSLPLPLMDFLFQGLLLSVNSNTLEYFCLKKKTIQKWNTTLFFACLTTFVQHYGCDIQSFQEDSSCCHLVPKSCPALHDPMDCSPPGSLSMGLSKQDYWSGLTFPSPGDLSDSGIETQSPALAGGVFITEPPGKCQHILSHRYAVISAPYSIVCI